MGNSHLKNKLQSRRSTSPCPATHVGREKHKTGSTLQRKASSKIEIKLSHEQLREVNRIFKDYDLQKPGWLRTRFINNQRRRKAINDLLREAGLDNAWCSTNTDKDWSGLLHNLWHQVNEVRLCK